MTKRYLVLVILLTLLISSYVFMMLWNWHVAYAFHLNQLSYVDSVGIVLFYGYVNPRIKSIKDQSTDGIFIYFMESIFYSLISIGLGWLVTLIR